VSALLTFVAFLLPVCFSHVASAAAAPSLTPQEQAWIRAHPVVRFIAESNLRPFEYLENGKVVGLIPSYLAIISSMTGLRFETVPSAGRGQSPEALQSRRADVTTVISRGAAERLGSNIILSRPFFVSGISIITDHQATVMFDLEDLAGKRVALKGQGGLEYMVRQKYPSIELLPYTTNEGALQAIVDGEADAAIGLEAILLPIVRRQYYGRLHVSGGVAYYPIAISMATRSDLPLLASIIDKSLAAIPVRQAERITESWLRLADYGEPSIASIVRYRAPQVIGAVGILFIFALLTIFSLRARAAALHSEREKAMFLAFMSHEIRTPMHTILSSLELLQRSPLNAKQAKRTRSAVVASETLLELLNDLLEYSRLESRGTQIELLATPIDAWARLTVDQVRWRAEEKGLSLTLEVACDPELNLIIDPTRLRQIALNLLQNAIKFTNRGTVTLWLDYSSAAKAGRPGELALKVSDTGIGLSEEQLPHIFDAFRQADISTTRHFGGSGLGLAICKELVTLMHGDIAVSSASGGLTSFTVRIPARCAESASSKAAEPGESGPVSHTQSSHGATGSAWTTATAPSDSPLLLVVDDHVAVQIAIRDQLEELGCDAILVGNGTMALDVFGQTRFDMVLLDCNLPDIDGYTVAERMRKHESSTAAEHTPIIAISAAVDDAHEERCMTSGMDGVIGKPLRLDLLREVIELWCPTDVSDSRGAESIDLAPRETLQQAYERNLSDDIDVIAQAIEQKDVSKIRYAAHRIKGSSHVAGHEDIAAIAGKFETALDATPPLSSEQLMIMLADLKAARDFQR
jgi:signal transduction histidine kinase/CheY-like chemotaxis protein